MQNTLLFVSNVLIWRSTWIAIAWQVGPVPVLVSVFYRFGSAGLILLLVLAACVDCRCRIGGTSPSSWHRRYACTAATSFASTARPLTCPPA